MRSWFIGSVLEDKLTTEYCSIVWPFKELLIDTSKDEKIWEEL
ncbi:MAG: hypothetical protein ACLQG5_07925 [Methanobacterium sp.]